MSLNSEKETAKVAVKNILEDMLTRSETSTEEFAERLIDVIEAWLRQAQINYVSGLTAPNGAVTGSFNGNLE